MVYSKCSTPWAAIPARTSPLRWRARRSKKPLPSRRCVPAIPKSSRRARRKSLALLARANAQFDSKAESTDKITVDRANWIKSICSYYEIELKWDGNQMTYGDMQKAQTEIEYQMDKEDNNLEQDMVSLQSYISKRDNAYTNAAKVVKKTLAAGASTIANIGS